MKLKRFAALGRNWPSSGRPLPFPAKPMTIFRSKDGKWDDLAWQKDNGDWVYLTTLPADQKDTV